MKQLLCLLFAAVAVTACAPAVPAGEFRIVGKIENVPDSAVVRLYEPQGQMLREWPWIRSLTAVFPSGIRFLPRRPFRSACI